MSDKLNITCIILGGHIQVHRYRYLYFLSLLAVYILIICCNTTIAGLIIVQKSLHEPMYIFIAALLINSVLSSTNIYPKLLKDILSQNQVITYPACLFQAFIFYSLSCSEFLLLAAMSYDRYVSICKPLQYPAIMTKTTVSILLILVWLLPSSHIVVPIVLNIKRKLCRFTLRGIFCNNSINQLYCFRSVEISMYAVALAFYVALFPVLFVLFTYAKILRVVYHSRGEVRKKAAQTCLPHLLVLINYCCLLIYDMVIVRLESNLPKIARFVVILQIVPYNPLCNPIIYGLKMKEISKHLKRLFCQAKKK